MAEHVRSLQNPTCSIITGERVGLASSHIVPQLHQRLDRTRRPQPSARGATGAGVASSVTVVPHRMTAGEGSRGHSGVL